MRNIKSFKLFEDFDNEEEYIVSSIRGILIELEDDGMEVEIEYHSTQGVTIEIKGNPVDSYPYVMHKEFEVSSIRDYGVEVKNIAPQVLVEKICSDETLAQANTRQKGFMKHAPHACSFKCAT